jgi:hypothetical protein
MMPHYEFFPNIYFSFVLREWWSSTTTSTSNPCVSVSNSLESLSTLMLSSIPIELSIGVDGYQDAATDKVGASTGVGVGVEVPITIGVGVGASI